MMGDRVYTEPNEEALKELAAGLIQAENTMTLATARAHVAWAAPVYYVFSNSCFYFFSDPTSRHIQETLASGQAASAIYASGSSWQEIRGIQMSGRVKAISVGFEAVEVVRAYLKKFSFTREFFSAHEDLDLSAFAKRFRVKLYRFKPDRIYYMDNSIRFGFRESVNI
jgi:uncharacterized protein YhbP (UPF0306 family)